MNECQAIVDRRAKGRMDLGGEKVEMLLPLGSFSAEVMFLGNSGDIVCVMVNTKERKTKWEGWEMEFFPFFLFFFPAFILTSLQDFSATMCNRIASSSRGEDV